MNLKEVKSMIDKYTVEVRETMGMVEQSKSNRYRFPFGEQQVFEKEYMINAPHEFTVDELLKKIETIDGKILVLRDVLAEKNQSVRIVFEGESISLTKAIYLLKNLRNKLPLYSRLSFEKETRDVIAPGRYNEDTKTYTEIRKPTFDVNEIREKVKEVEKRIMTLQTLIDAANISTEVEVEL